MRHVLALCGVLVAGCATPYQRHGFSGGYQDRQLGPNRYLIEVNVNSYTSQSTAIAYVHRRASELCRRRGYIIEDGNSEEYYQPGLAYNSRTKQYEQAQYRKAAAMAVVQCKVRKKKRKPAEPAIAAPAEPCKVETPLATWTNPPALPSQTELGPITDQDFYDAALYAFAAVGNWPIATRDPDAGHIATEWLEAPPIMGKCGDRAVELKQSLRLRFVVFSGVANMYLECRMADDGKTCPGMEIAEDTAKSATEMAQLIAEAAQLRANKRYDDAVRARKARR